MITAKILKFTMAVMPIFFSIVLVAAERTSTGTIKVK